MPCGPCAVGAMGRQDPVFAAYPALRKAAETGRFQGTVSFVFELPMELSKASILRHACHRDRDLLLHHS